MERLVVVTISDEDLETQRRFSELVSLPTEAAMGDIGWDAATFRPFTIIIDHRRR
ncbi:MAG TPA: hypothetical protein VM534_00880 [Thermoanaerobaculia bacterium]|nr:hypothetical protein [Thermoanaerobaculia bacterium]